LPAASCKWIELKEVSDIAYRQEKAALFHTQGRELKSLLILILSNETDPNILHKMALHCIPSLDNWVVLFWKEAAKLNDSSVSQLLQNADADKRTFFDYPLDPGEGELHRLCHLLPKILTTAF
jgi:hypothetical protein